MMHGTIDIKNWLLRGEKNNSVGFFAVQHTAVSAKFRFQSLAFIFVHVTNVTTIW